MKLYIVGGAVRDKLLGLEPKDVDFVVVGATVEEMSNLYGEPVGKDFPVYLGIVPGFEKFGKVEIAMARKEKQVGKLHTDFEFEFGPEITLEEDLARRDFTINALAEDIVTGEITDPFDGRIDLKNKLIRHTNTQAFVEDPLRVLRMARFAARFNFKVNKETLRLARQMDITNLTMERLWWEIRKVLDTDKPAVFFEILRQTGHLKQILPELLALHGVEQAHHEEDAYTHTMFVIAEGVDRKLSNRAIYALLLHDLGKGVTPKEELPHHYNHEDSSRDLARKVSQRLKVPNSYQRLAEWFALNHMKLHKINDMRDGKVIRVAKQILDSHFEPKEIIKMSSCDSMGRLGESYNTDFKRLEKAVFIIHNTKADEFVAKGFKGIQIKEMLHQKMTQLMNNPRK